MKILLIGNYLPDAQESMQRFTQMLDNGFSRKGHQVKVIRPHPFLRRFDIAPFSAQKFLGYFDKYIAFPFAHEFKSYVEWADLVHIIDHSNSIYIPYIKDKKYLLTCNDLLAIRSAFGDFPQNPTGLSGKILQRWILNNINKAKYVACISKSTKNDLLRISKISQDNISVVYMGLNYRYSANLTAIVNIAGYDLRSITYILHVGGNQWYKNRLGVLSVYKRLLDRTSGDCPKLVMVGKPFTSKLESFIRENALHDHVISLVSVPNEQLEELYSNAIALLFPSLMEGFGWPVIEAQACGCPVVCSNEGPLPEVAGEAALMAPALDEDQLADHLYSLMMNPELRSDLIQKGLENVKRFSPEKMIQQYVELYEKILADSPS